MKAYEARIALILLSVVVASTLGSCTGSPVVPAWSSLLMVGDILYTGSQVGRVYALNAASAVEIWQYPPAAEKAGIGALYAPPVILDDTVYVGSADGHLYALDASTGSQRWKFASSGSIVAGSVIFDGALYVSSGDGRVYALDATSGLKEWEFATGDWIWGRPAVADGRVYVTSFDHRVYSLDAETGQKQWEFEAQGAGGDTFRRSFSLAARAQTGSDGLGSGLTRFL